MKKIAFYETDKKDNFPIMINLPKVTEKKMKSSKDCY